LQVEDHVVVSGDADDHALEPFFLQCTSSSACHHGLRIMLALGKVPSDANNLTIGWGSCYTFGCLALEFRRTWS
jgi:hypothetical protein